MWHFLLFLNIYVIKCGINGKNQSGKLYNCFGNHFDSRSIFARLREQKYDNDKFGVIPRCLQRNSRAKHASPEMCKTALGYNT